MKNIILLIFSVLLLSACTSNGDPSERAMNIIESNLTEQPQKGDVILVELNSSEQFIFAHVEKDTEVTVSEEDDNILEIRYEEPNESDDLMMHSIEIEERIEDETIKVYINDIEKSMMLIYE